MKKYYEIFFTKDYIDEYGWLDFLYYMIKLNGRFKSFSIYIKFKNNYVRYFLKADKEIPTTLGNLGLFLIKEINNFNNIKIYFKSVYFLRSKYQNVIDLFDNFESKKNKRIKEVEIKIFPYCYDNYLSATNIVLENAKGRLSSKKVFLNIPHLFLGIDFEKHTRFLYSKNIRKYLNVEKALNVFECDKKQAILKIDAFPFIQDNYFLNLSNYDFDKHSLIIGGSGTGKSKLISLFVNNLYNNPIYKNKYKILLIDPHSSLEEDIGGLDNTQVIDFESENSSIDLFMNKRDNIVSDLEVLMSLFKNLMAKEYNSKLERVLRYSLFLLICIEKVDLINLRNLITNNEFRNNLIKSNKEILPEPILNFFNNDFLELKNKSHNESISPILAFIDEMTTLSAFNLKERKGNLKKLIEDNFLSIISLSESQIGEKATKTISGLVIGQLFSIMQKKFFEEHIILIIDEISVIQNPIIKRFLSESRKYNVSVILSGQYFNQIEDTLQKAIFANVTNYYTFRVSREDGIILSRNMLMELAVHDSHFAKVKMLSELSNRECIVRLSKNGNIIPAFKARTLDVKSIPRVKLSQNENNNIVKEFKNKKINFSIDTKASIKDLMKSQSTGRRKIISEG